MDPIEEEVIAEFSKAHTLPLPKDVDHWVSKYPQYGKQIRDRARELVEQALAEMTDHAHVRQGFRERARETFDRAVADGTIATKPRKALSRDEKDARREEELRRLFPRRPAARGKPKTYEA